MQDARKRFKERWHRIDILYNRFAKQSGLNFTAILVLESLEEPGVNYTQKALCEKLALPKQYINGIISTFWEKGYVELKEAKDRRNKTIHLTEKGEAYSKAISKPLEDAEDAAWAAFTDEEMVVFTNALEKYERKLAEALSLSAV